MPNIRPISDLRNYSEVLREVESDSPVFLTKNGRGKYAIVDINEYEQINARLKLLSLIEKGRRSGEEKGYIDASDVRTRYEAKMNE